MTRKLNEADRAAVDMMFDRLNAAGINGNGNGNGKGHAGDGFVAMTAPVDEQRLQAVERVLSMIDQMPANDPPADLATRTLQRIARATGTPAGATVPAMPAFINPNQPMA